MALTLIELAAQLRGWRGAYLRYAFAITSTVAIPEEYRPHLDRVIVRRSGISSTDGLRPDDPGREVRSKIIAAYLADTARRRDTLADYRLARAVHDVLRHPEVAVMARNASGTIETLRPADLREASIDLAANAVTIGKFAYQQMQVEVPATLARGRCLNSSAGRHAEAAPLARPPGGANAIDDAALLEKVRARAKGVSIRAAIIQNTSSDMTAEQQDSVVHRVQRKHRKGLKR